MGDMSGSCETLSLKGPLDSIQASDDGTAVTAITYFRGSSSKSYGTLDTSFKRWTFDDTNVLIGMHGRVDGTVIK